MSIFISYSYFFPLEIDERGIRMFVIFINIELSSSILNEDLFVQRLSNLRVNANFNDHLCMKVTDACARVGALDYGMVCI